ncbi:MAG: (d)CMP kinase [Epulopiscium sp.]|nr:(d)CMP kinase [Candidatus Epulonipiscium sp.]
MEYISVAIDGPAGAGKSTIAKAVAKALRMTYVDTGAMYRSVALYCIQYDIQEKSQIEMVMDKIHITLSYEDGEQKVFLNGRDVTNEIRTPEVAKMSSYIATFPTIRQQLVEIQREMARKQSVVMDGRDIGTYVLPDAPVKIFLTASTAERARRRYHEMQTKGIVSSIAEIQAEIEQRDEQDMNRIVSPLKKAADAIEIDTTSDTIEEVVQKILDIIDKRRI